MKSILKAQGRLRKLSPVAIIDIGSNSVRLVVYEGLSRSPTPLFNEKILCGLGAHIATTGRLDDLAVERALAALKRFRMLAKQAGADDIHILATAAARDAENGPAFIDEAQKILGCEIHVLTGAEEAHFAALGIVCGFNNPIGVSADMGGGSVEFSLVEGAPIYRGITLPLGGLRLKDEADGDVTIARQIVRDKIAKNELLKEAKGGVFYAVGGTWRAMGRLHMARTNYPLSVMHHYELSAEEAAKLCRRLMQSDVMKMRGMNAVSSSRRALLPYGAALLYEILKLMKPEKIVISGVGVREGYLYSLLPPKVQKADPLISAAEEMAVLRSRSPSHARELVSWTSQAFKAFGIEETKQEKRYRIAACMLADITWRAHPEYRGDQALNILSNANFMGVDHPGRVFIALSSYYRHEGLVDDAVSPSIRKIVSDRVADRAKLTGALFRVGYLLSAAMPGVLSKLKIVAAGDGAIEIQVPEYFADFEGERLNQRIKGLATVSNRKINWVVM